MSRPPDGHWYGRLDRALIVDAALRIAARPGVGEIRVKDLGVELGADPTAIYRHFRGKADLLAAVTDRMMADLAASLPTGPWRTVLEAVATEAFERFLAHPAVGAQLMDARPVGPGEYRLVEIALRAFEEAGLSEDAVVEQYGAFSGMLLAYIAGACRAHVTFGANSGGVEGAAWLPSVESLGSEYPAVARHTERLTAMDYRSTYFAGVRALIP